MGLLLRNGPSDRERAVRALEGVLRNQFVAPGQPFHGTWRLYDESEEPRDPTTATDWKGWDSNWREFKRKRSSASGKSNVSVWARHLAHTDDSGLRLPTVWQQFLDATVHV